MSVPENQAGTQLAKVTTELDDIARMGMWLAAAESGSKDANAQGMAAALRMAYANRLGLPLHAAQEIHLIGGNLTLSAKLCRGLAHQHGLRVERVEETDDSCTAAVVEESTGRELGRSTFTLAMAARAGLGRSRSGKPTGWSTNPERMLWARASKRALDDFAPWVTVGVIAIEEIGEPELEDTVLEPDEVIPPEDDIPFGDPD